MRCLFTGCRAQNTFIPFGQSRQVDQCGNVCTCNNSQSGEVGVFCNVTMGTVIESISFTYIKTCLFCILLNTGSKVCKMQSLATKGDNPLPAGRATPYQTRFRIQPRGHSACGSALPGFIAIRIRFPSAYSGFMYNVASESSKIDNVLTSDLVFNLDFLCFRLPVL